MPRGLDSFGGDAVPMGNWPHTIDAVVGRRDRSFDDP